MDISDAIRKHVHNERLIIINLAWLSLRQIRRFKSDFRHVAKMLRCLRLKKTYRPPKNIRLDHPVEFGQVWYACTKDPRIAEFFEEDRDKEVKMCEFLDCIEARGFKKGEKRGEKNGVKIGVKIGEEKGEQRGENRGEKRGKKEGRNTERHEIKLVVEYLKSLGKSDEFPDLLDHPRKYRRYLKEAMAVYESVSS